MPEPELRLAYPPHRLIPVETSAKIHLGRDSAYSDQNAIENLLLPVGGAVYLGPSAGGKITQVCQRAPHLLS